jgi:hypothetical protein
MPVVPPVVTVAALIGGASIALIGCGSVTVPRSAGGAPAAAVSVGPSDAAHAAVGPAPLPDTVDRALARAGEATPADAPGRTAGTNAPAAPPTPATAHRFVFEHDPEDMCRQDLAFASDTFDTGPGTPRMDYDLLGTVDGVHYELDWQVVPWHGAGSYTFGEEKTLSTWLYLMRLPDHTVFLAPGGTVSASPNGRSGTLNATVVIADGRRVDLSGPWSCGDAQ